jgi:vancomycin permeability regulator SanA
MSTAFESNDDRRGGMTAFLLDPLPRGMALFLGGFTLLNLAGGIRHPGFDTNLWWIDLRAVPSALANSFLLLSALCLIAFAARPPRAEWRRWTTLACAGALILMAAINAAQFYVLLARRSIHTGFPVPLSLVLASLLGLVCWSCLRPWWLASRRCGGAAVLAVASGFALLFPVALMICFGKTDYRRPADVAVVLGARVYADGRPSDALADRVRTACQLYREGCVRKLVFSGGPGDGAVHETEAMKRLALKLGVRPEDVLQDDAGLNTQATVKNTQPLFRQLHARRILVVSHAYHLPRIKLDYQREGVEVFTVPAKESYFLRQMPYNMAREVAAFWVYYLRSLRFPSQA